MMKKKLPSFPAIALLLFGGVFPQALHAQETQEPPPRPQAPFIAPIPKEAHWRIILKYPGAESEAADQLPTEVKRTRISSIETEQSGGVRKVTAQYADGSQKVYHHLESYVFTRQGAVVRLRTLVKEPPPYPGFAEGYLYIPKLEASMFQGLEKVEGRECFRYATPEADVWVDATTMLPVAARAADALAVFTILPPPAGAVNLPPEETALLKKQQRALSAFRAMR